MNCYPQFVTVRSLKVVKDGLPGECIGNAFIRMDGDEAQAAIAGLDGVKNKGRFTRDGLHWPSYVDGGGE